MISQEQISKHNLGLSAQCKSLMCCAKNANSKVLETPKINPPRGLTVHPQAPADFVGCSRSL